jgi:diguanylate cyclase (GGDEF)-like protein
MSDHLTEELDAKHLLEEISRLRAHVAQLQERVEELDELAHQDTLIDMPNRRGFMRALERFIDRARRYGEQSAMLFVDLDGLKTINDSFGHQAGDVALIQAARMLVGGVRRSDVVARLGGDEFAILLAHTDEDNAHETASRLADMIANCEISHDGDELPLSVAIGVAMIGPDDDAEAIMARADEEMYRRKAAA